MDSERSKERFLLFLPESKKAEDTHGEVDVVVTSSDAAVYTVGLGLLPARLSKQLDIIIIIIILIILSIFCFYNIIYQIYH